MTRRGVIWWVVAVAALATFVVLDVRGTGGSPTTALLGAALGLIMGTLGFATAGAVHGSQPGEGLRLSVALGGPPGAFIAALVLAEGVTPATVIFCLAVAFAAGAFAHILKRLASFRREMRGE